MRNCSRTTWQALNREDILKLYDRITSVVEKLPGGIQKPILAELQPIREVFIEQRAPRIVLLGSPSAPTTPSFLHDLTDHAVETGTAASGWRTYRIADRGAIEILDARQDVPDGVLESALSLHACDVVLLLCNTTDDAAPFTIALESAKQRIAIISHNQSTEAPVIGLALAGDQTGTHDGLSAQLRAQANFVPIAVFALNADTRQIVAETLCSSLPLSARLEFARFTMARGAQTEIAERLLKSFAALCGVIGVQPIPLADLPVLTALQSLMVSLIVYVSGRRVSPKLVAEFAAAVGINVGAGFVFREGARAIVKFIPVWGNAVSGVVAGAGTYAIGRAAIAYFIEGGTGSKALREIRKRFPLLNKPS